MAFMFGTREFFVFKDSKEYLNNRLIIIMHCFFYWTETKNLNEQKKNIKNVSSPLLFLYCIIKLLRCLLILILT